MPNMANITVKNAAGTDVVYNAATASAGDKVPARWSQDLASGIQGFRPKLEMTTLTNGEGSVRRAEFTFLFPITYTDTATGLVKMNSSIKITSAVFLPASLTTDQWNEAFVQYGNLMVSALIRAGVQTGYAPT